MKHVVISDTHAPVMVEKILAHVKTLPDTDIDAIVINGDLLGVFSMAQSNVHRADPLTEAHLAEYLRTAAPTFAGRIEHGPVTAEMLIDYVEERYSWTLDVLKRFAAITHTIFNMGNHESPHHFLVLQELSFLAGIDEAVLNRLPQDRLQAVYDAFEQQLFALEREARFTYLRHKPVLHDGIILLAIPGEHHDAVGNHPVAKIQEERTQDLIRQAQPLLKDATGIVVYHHTFGAYDRDTGFFSVTSPALRHYMANLPERIKTRVFVQSHNHWSYTQFIHREGFHFILNNAGLHDGIYNILDIDDESVRVEDLCSDSDARVPVKLRSHAVPSDHFQLIQAHYPNALDIFFRRRTRLLKD